MLSVLTFLESLAIILIFWQSALYVERLPRNVILAKLKVDARGRLFVSKSVRDILSISAGDEIVITREGPDQVNALTLAIQREGNVAKVWRLVQERD